MSKSTTAPIAPQAAAKTFTNASVVLAPGASKSMGLGAYAAAQDPRFDLRVEPDIGDSLTATLDRLEIPGTRRYMLFYQLHNYGDTACEVTIARTAAAA